MPSNVLELQVNGTAEAYTLPNLVLKSLSTSIDPSKCGKVEHSVQCKDSSNTVVPATFATYFSASNQLSIKATKVDQVGTYSLALIGTLDSNHDVTQTYQLFDLEIVAA